MSDSGTEDVGDEGETLYQRLGGREAIEAVVDRFYDRMLDDERVAGFFEDVDMQRQRSHQTQFISAVTGGPVEYTGEEMREAHAHLDIDERDFEVVATHLDETLQQFYVADEDRRAVMNEVYALEDPIVGR